MTDEEFTAYENQCKENEWKENLRKSVVSGLEWVSVVLEVVPEFFPADDCWELACEYLRLAAVRPEGAPYLNTDSVTAMVDGVKMDSRQKKAFDKKAKSFVNRLRGCANQVHAAALLVASDDRAGVVNDLVKKAAERFVVDSCE